MYLTNYLNKHDCLVKNEAETNQCKGLDSIYTQDTCSLCKCTHCTVQVVIHPQTDSFYPWAWLTLPLGEPLTNNLKITNLEMPCIQFITSKTTIG